MQGAKFKKRVLVVERGQRVGGVSVHTGTIPSKTLRETVLNLSGWRERGFYGRAYRAKKDITAADLRKRLHITLDHEVEGLEHQFARNTVETIIGAARFLDPHTVEVESATGVATYSADRFVIAVGTRPATSSSSGAASTQVSHAPVSRNVVNFSFPTTIAVRRPLARAAANNVGTKMGPRVGE